MHQRQWLITWRSFSDFISRITELLSSFFLISIAVVLFGQVVLRYVFQSGIIFAEEFSKYSVIWIVMLTANILVKNDQLIKVDFMDNYFSSRFIKYRNLICKFILCCIVITLIIEGWQQSVNSWVTNSMMVTLGITYFWAFISIPVGGIIILFQIITSWLPTSYRNESNIHAQERSQ
jgi:TRAP-type C4-dicarboxylate transport system permease small subunit